MRWMCWILCFVAFGVGGEPEKDRFEGFRVMTEKPVFVNPGLAALCRGANKEEVAEARQEKGPHAYSEIVVKMNDIAADDFKEEARPFREGAVVVKEKLLFPYRKDDGRLSREKLVEAYGWMVKREAGYDPEHGDWEYFYEEEGKEPESGRIASCIDCHENASKKDYVFGSWADEGRMVRSIVGE